MCLTSNMSHDFVQVSKLVDGNVVEGEEHVAIAQAGLLRGRIRLHIIHKTNKLGLLRARVDQAVRLQMKAELGVVALVVSGRLSAATATLDQQNRAPLVIVVRIRVDVFLLKKLVHLNDGMCGLGALSVRLPSAVDIA